MAFDTNVLYTGSASDLVRQEAGNMVTQSAYPDLEVLWYLPEVVRHERQYQMRKRALELLPSVAKVERLLGHNLNITQEILVDRVEKAVTACQNEMGLLPIKLDYSKVDWDRIVLDAVYRRPPFQDGETEKGFRDALVVESFMQLVADSPKSSSTCRLVLVTGDKLVAESVENRIVGMTNTRVLPSLEELKGLINTLISTVDEALIAELIPKAGRLFFIPKDEAKLYYKEHIRDRLFEKFKADLTALPSGASARKNGTLRISLPSFAKKAGQRIHWSSRVEIEAEATKVITEERRSIVSAPSFASQPISLLPEVKPTWMIHTDILKPSNPLFISSGGAQTQPAIAGMSTSLTDPSRFLELFPSTRQVTTHRGSDVYEICWSADLTTAGELRRPTIDDIVHVEMVWESAF